MDNKNFIINDFVSSLQKNIVFDNSRIILINGCAGSRKTDTIIKKGIHELCQSNLNILFLTFVSSVTNEIKSRIENYLDINIPKINSSNHYLTDYKQNFIEISNIDAWIYKQYDFISNNTKLSNNKYAINYNDKVINLINLSKEQNFYNIVLKNNKFADVILIDEFQDTDINKVNLLLDFINFNKNLKCVVAGDIMQTIFADNIDFKNYINPITLFKERLNPKYYEINISYRCPAAHIEFTNYLLEDHYSNNNINLMKYNNNDFFNKPVLFMHDSISCNKKSYKLAKCISHTIIDLLNKDKSIKPEDIVIIMKKSNNNTVFEQIKIILNKLFLENNISNYNFSNIIHFETNGDGYSNTINWNNVDNKTILLSIHGDKGKGHKAVFLLGLTQNSIPNEFNIGKKSELFEASLLNVALTRSLKYLFIGFTFNYPSCYLTNKSQQLNEFCYLAWNKKTWCYNYPYNSLINTLNYYWFDNLKWYYQKPKFILNSDINIDLPIKLKLNVRNDISKDMLPYLNEIITHFDIQGEALDIYDDIHIFIDNTIYPIIGFVGELLLQRNYMIENNDFDIFSKINTNMLFYDESIKLLNLAYDYKINNYINDYNSWKEKILEMELDIINDDNDPKLLFKTKFLLNLEKPVIFLNKYFKKLELKKYIDLFCSNVSNDEITKNYPKCIFIIAFFYYEYNNYIRKNFDINIIENFLNDKNYFYIIKQINNNVNIIWKKFFINKKLEFQKNLNIHKNILNRDLFNKYKLDPTYHKKIFNKGLNLSINGKIDILELENSNLFEIKTCIKTSFSNEWVIQIITYNILLNIIYGKKINENYIINLFTGFIYKINFNSDINILINILKKYNYDLELINLFINF